MLLGPDSKPLRRSSSSRDQPHHQQPAKLPAVAAPPPPLAAAAAAAASSRSPDASCQALRPPRYPRASRESRPTGLPPSSLSSSAQAFPIPIDNTTPAHMRSYALTPSEHLPSPPDGGSQACPTPHPFAMRMTGNALCRVWSQTPGLSEPWCMQIQWRIGQDEELIAALTEPRYPCADESFDTIILTQTIYLCQLLLHLQEFDPCTGVLSDNQEIDEELSRVFQDCIAREYNVAYDMRVRDGPAPDGEALERVVKGLMRAQLEGSKELSAAKVEPSATTALIPASSAGREEEEHEEEEDVEESKTRVRLQQVLVATLAELLGTVRRRPVRYEVAYGPRTDATWAARFSTRIMQWRHLVRGGSAALVRGVVEVQPHDVLPLDEEGMQVYQILRSVAPGRIHVASPVQPEMPATRPWSLNHHFASQQQQQQQQQQQGHHLRYPQQPQQQQQQQHHHHPHHHHRHTRSVSSGIRMAQPAFGSPLAHTPVSTPSESSDTPRTTPQYPYQPLSAGSHTMEGSSKRASQEMSYPPPTKRLQLMVPAAVPGPGGEVPTNNLPIRCGPMDIDRPEQDEEASSLDTKVLLSRVLSRVTELGQKIESMQHGMDAKMNQLDERLQRIQESLI